MHLLGRLTAPEHLSEPPLVDSAWRQALLLAFELDGFALGRAHGAASMRHRMYAPAP